MKFQIFCDGACTPNPGVGGWAALVKDENGNEQLLCESVRDQTTNNRMELIAALRGIERAVTYAGGAAGQSITVTTDSQYLVKGMTEWITGWRRRNWVSAAGKPVENRDLWEALLTYDREHAIRWTWVRGHNGHVENERVDKAAREAAQAAKAPS